MFERYSEFLKPYHLVLKAYSDANQNRSRYNMSKLNNEYSHACGAKREFEGKILSGIEKFVKNYQNEYSKILSGYNSLIRSISEYESNEMKKFSTYFT
jgi:hypothetical protein